VLVFSDLLESKRQLLEPDSLLLVAGSVSTREEESPKIVASDLFPLAQCRHQLVEHIEVVLNQSQMDDDSTRQITAILDKYPGACPVVFLVENPGERPVKIRSKRLRVSPEPELFQELGQLLGSQAFRFCGRWQPQNGRRQGSFRRRD
jgi:DNA polymerase III alpha subunit